MPIDFFQKEVAKVQNRFSQTFGKSTVANLNVRFDVILSIINLDWIADNIRKSKPTKSREKVKEFMRCKAALCSIFNKRENEINKERGLSDARDEYELSNDAGRFGSVRDMR